MRSGGGIPSTCLRRVIDGRRFGDYRARAMLTIIPPSSGSVGNLTYSHNNSGAYVRQRSNPTQPRTPAQVARRATLTALSAAWRGLTSAQQASWSAFGQSFTTVNRIGTAIHLTGLQCYVKVNAVNTLVGDATVSTPPALPTFVACSVTGVTAVSATPLISVQGANPASGTKNMIFASPQLSAGVTFNGNYRYLTLADTFTSGAASIQTAYAAKFGALISGKKIFVKCVQDQAGMQDNGTIFSCIVS
jgi:hypothetical protein